MEKRIYLDNNATTMVCPKAAQEMQKYHTTFYGNPSSLHTFGIETRVDLRRSLDYVYKLINAPDQDDVLITSGATEANNHVLKAVFLKNLNTKKNHYITTNVEHPTIYNTLQYLESLGAEVTYLPVGPDGIVKAEQVEAAVTNHTVLISIMHANNELGTIFPLAEMVQRVKKKNSQILFHTDATQTLGKISVDVEKLGVDYLSFSAHKFHGPKGIGGLYMRKGQRLDPFFHGGEQMASLRAGTLNVAGIVGMGIAAQEAVQYLDLENTVVRQLRDKLETFILNNIHDTFLNGHKNERTPNTLNIAFQNCEGEALLWDLNQHGIAASTGSACASEELESSRVLRALGVDKALSHMALRFSLSRYTTAAEIDYVISVLPGIIKRLREISSGKA